MRELTAEEKTRLEEYKIAMSKWIHYVPIAAIEKRIIDSLMWRLRALEWRKDEFARGNSSMLYAANSLYTSNEIIGDYFRDVSYKKRMILENGGIPEAYKESMRYIFWLSTTSVKTFLKLFGFRWEPCAAPWDF